MPFGEKFLAIEIEAKLKIESFAPLIERLSRFSAKRESLLRQVDTYLDNKNKDMLTSDCSLRLRSESDLENPENSQIILAYKGPRNDDKYKSREEIETNISDIDAFCEIMKKLGYERSLSFDKLRETWLLDDCLVCLDRLPLIGNFVEIEAASQEAISKVISKLSIETLNQETKSYACMIQESLKEKGIESRVLYLEQD